MTITGVIVGVQGHFMRYYEIRKKENCHKVLGEGDSRQ